jgi:anthranilate synthase component 2
MRPRILILDNYDSFTYNLVQLVEENGGIAFVEKNDQIMLDSVEDFDKILFSPGAGVPSDFPIMRQIVEQYSRSKSILGICLGHQAIAEAYGGRLYNMPEVMHGKKYQITVKDQTDYLFKGLPTTFEVGLYHSWAVDPEYMLDQLNITAMSSNGIIMALSHNTDDVKGIQFHPESYMTGNGNKIIRSWIQH